MIMSACNIGGLATEETTRAALLDRVLGTDGSCSSTGVGRRFSNENESYGNFIGNYNGE
jgi:hypothetical protein